MYAYARKNGTSPSGLEGGTEQIRAFAELGFGEQGILLAGL